MDDKVSSEVQSTVDSEGAGIAAKKDIVEKPSEGTATKEEHEIKGQTVEKEKLKEGSVEAKKGQPATEQRRQPQQSEDFQRKRMYFRKKVCRLCAQKTTSVDYKNVDLLRRYVTDRGKILPRRITGNCAKHQRMLAKAIKRARMAALLPFVSK